MDRNKIDNKAGLIWNIADKLQGDYKPHEYGDVIMAFTVLRRFDSVLAPTKKEVFEEASKHRTITQPIDALLKRKAGDFGIYNISRYDFHKLLDDADNILPNFQDYVNGFSEEVKEILSEDKGFDFDRQIRKLANSNLLYLIIQEFSKQDLHPNTISNIEMGYIFEEIIRRFSETYNADAGEFYTPREIIELMVNLLLDGEDLNQPNKVIQIYDGACGTGGMLSIAYDRIKEINNSNRILVHGQEINPQTYATCKSDMILKGGEVADIKFGSTLSNDQFKGETFDYIIMNPPFGRDWKKDKNAVEKEFKLGEGGRFKYGLPAISDSQLLFMQNAVSKMNPSGSKVAIIHNASALFQDGKENGSSEVRRYLIENDLLDTIIQLPNSIFYNTGIATYIWLLSNKKPQQRKGKIQLIDASKIFIKRRKPLGEKRNDISTDQITEITKIYNDFKPSEICKIFNNLDFAFNIVTVLQPMLNEDGTPQLDKKGKPIPSKEKDTETISFKEDIAEYMKREVLPYALYSYIDESKTVVWYEIPFTKHFYKYTEPRKSAEILAEIMEIDKKLQNVLKEMI